MHGDSFSEMDDEALMVLLCESNPQAWTEMVTRFGRLVYSIAYQILKNESDTEDAVQNTFIRLQKYSKNFDPSSTLKPWLFKIASGEAIRIYNNRKKISKKESVRSNSFSVESSMNKAEAHMEQKELEVLIKKAIDILPEQSRIAITLYYVVGMNQTEIAKELGLSQFSISEKINSGIKNIRTYLKQSEALYPEVIMPALLSKGITERSIPKALEHKILSQNFLEGKIKPIHQTKLFLTTTVKIALSAIGVILASWPIYSYLHNEKPLTNTTTSLKINTKDDPPTEHSSTEMTVIDFFKSSVFPLKINTPEADPKAKGKIFYTPHSETINMWTKKISTTGSEIFELNSNDHETHGFSFDQKIYQNLIITGKIKWPQGNHITGFLMSNTFSKDKVEGESQEGQLISSIIGENLKEVEFKIFMIVIENHLISLFVCKSLKNFYAFSQRSMPYHLNGYNLGLLGKGKMQILDLKAKQMPMDWDFKKEESLKTFLHKLPNNLVDFIKE